MGKNDKKTKELMIIKMVRNSEEGYEQNIDKRIKHTL